MTFLPVPENLFLNEALEIDPSSPSGLRWKDRPRHHFRTQKAYCRCMYRDFGKPAGSSVKMPDGKIRWVVKLSGKKYQSHRIVYALANGSLSPLLEVDHINRDTEDNRPENLRASTRSQNASNKSLQSNNRSGVRGVTWCSRTQLWMAQIGMDGKNIFLGRFKTKEEAAKVRLEASQKHHGEFAGEAVAQHFQATQ